MFPSAPRPDIPHTPNLDPPTCKRPVECPFEDWLTFLGHRWNALILWHLQEGPVRNIELSKCLPAISSKVLVQRLAELQQRGLVARTALPAFPRNVAYELSPKGQALIEVLNQLETWARMHDRPQKHALDRLFNQL